MVPHRDAFKPDNLPVFTMLHIFAIFQMAFMLFRYYLRCVRRDHAFSKMPAEPDNKEQKAVIPISTHLSRQIL